MAGCKKDVKEDYRGEYPHLYTVAINSLLGAEGYLQSEVKHDSSIKIIEEDLYDRTLFLYYENNFVSTYSLIISQRSDETHVYFYPDYNFISISNDEKEDIGLRWTSEADFSSAEIKNNVIRDLYNKALGEDAYHYKTYTYYFQTDVYGRSIYLARGKYSTKRFIAMLFRPDGIYDESKCLMELEDLQNYQDELIKFKEINNWDQPLK